MEKIKVKHVATYKDGGTKEYHDSLGNRYFKDNRIGSGMKGKIYNMHPGRDGAKMLNVELEEVKEL